MQSVKPDDDYSDVITRPTLRKMAPREAETHAEEEQNFLSRLLQQLQLQHPQIGSVNGAMTGSPAPPGVAVSSSNSGTPIRGVGVGVQKPVDRRSSSSTIPNQVKRTPQTRLSTEVIYYFTLDGCYQKWNQWYFRRCLG